MQSSTIEVLVEDRQQEWDALLLKQRELEDACMAQGAKRFKKKLARAVEKEQQATFGGAKRLLTGNLEPLEAAITEWAEGRRSGPVHCSVKWLKLVGSETAAYMTLKVVLDGIDKKRSLYKVATGISDLIVDELRFRRFEELAPELFKYKMEHFHTSSYAHMARSLDGSLKGLRCSECLAKVEDWTLSEKRKDRCEHMASAFDDLDISQNHRYNMGIKLVDLLIHATGMVDCVTDQTTVAAKGRKMQTRSYLMVEATADTLEWLAKRNGFLESLTPVNLPMVMPPLQWGQGEHGGYRFALREKYPLVRGVSKAQQKVLDEANMPLVYEALNAIQNTAWTVNRAVLSVLEAIVENGGGLAGVPLYVHEPLPAKPANMDSDDRDAEFARVEWKRKAAKVRRLNKMRERDMVEFNRRLDIVNTVRDEAAIFFPHTLDFRGRVYPIPTTVSPQGDDISKGLLTFAQGKPIGAEGGRWLAIHGANCLGEWNERKVSKMTLDERCALIETLMQEIFDAGNDPLTHTWWTKADEPVQFLAFCIEWMKWTDTGHDPDFISTLPVSIDGTCNGLQHFSAMLRDPIGGRAVNLTPLSTPQDVYADIAEHCLDQMEKEITSSPYARLWMTSGLVKRKLTKRPTMTFGYGSKPYGFQQQLCEYVQTLGANTEESSTLYEGIKRHFTLEGAEEPEIVQACGYMSSKIWRALQETMVAASKGMEWLQKCARVVIKNGAGVKWVVPVTNFPVRQDYFVQQVRQIETMIAGRVIKPTLYSNTAVVESHRQANAIAPNVVHSLDAAALMLTVTQAAHEGVESFAAIHDSYGCLAGDMTVLAAATRQSFVNLYTRHDVVADLHRQFTEQAATELPTPPKAGTLDVAQVLASDYFFS